MNWQLKVSNWLSNGALEKSQRKLAETEAKLVRQENTIDNLEERLAQSQIEQERLKAQFTMSQGFQIELGEAEVKLRSALSEVESLKQEVAAKNKEVFAITDKYRQATAQLAKSQDWLRLSQVPIKVVEISKLLPKSEFNTLWGFGIFNPRADTQIIGGAVTVRGWVLGRKVPVQQVQILIDNEVVLSVGTGKPRPMIAQQYPDIPQAGQSGFECSLAVAGMPQKAELIVQALLEDQKIIPLCAIALEKLSAMTDT